MEEFSKKSKYLVIVSVVLAIGLIASTFIATQGYNRSKTTYGIVKVTGSAKRQIKSDFAVWNGYFSVQNVSLTEAYKQIKSQQQVVKEYLIQKGVPESELSFSSISTMTNYSYNAQGYPTSDISSYRLSQNVEIRSNDVDKTASIARESTELIDRGVTFESYSPQYFYTKIADLKIDMLALASADAKNRAQTIAENAGTTIIGVKTSNMGVFQITPLYSNEISDYGINDTSSIEKEIMSVMNCEFKTK